MESDAARLTALKLSIKQGFPATRYDGQITPCDDDLDREEFDEDKDLYDGLKGRVWTEIPKTLLHHLPGGYVLLTNDAFVAFFAAWLMYSLEDLDQENEVRNFLVYSFCEDSSRLGALNSEQRHTLRSLIVEFTARGTVPFVQRLAVQALELIDRFERKLKERAAEQHG